MKKKLNGAKTPLERHVRKWINSAAADYGSDVEGVLEDLFYGGRDNWPGYLVENNGGERFIISEDSAKIMGGPEQKFMARMYQIQEERKGR